MIRTSKFLKLWHKFDFFNPKTVVMSITTMIRTRSSWIGPNKLLPQKRSPMSMMLTECKPCKAIQFYHSRTPVTNSPIQTIFMQPSSDCYHVKIFLLLLIINVNSSLRAMSISPGSVLLKSGWPTNKLDYALSVLIRISAMTTVILNGYGWSFPYSLNFWDWEVDILDFFRFSLRCFWSHLREIKMKREARLTIKLILSFVASTTAK